MSIATVQQQEAALVAVLKEAASRLDGVGTTEVSAALQTLQQAADAARQRLEAAAGEARSIFAALAGDAGNVASSLSASLFGEAKSDTVSELIKSDTVSDFPAPLPSTPPDDDDEQADESQLPHPCDPIPAGPDADDDVDELAAAASPVVTPIAADDGLSLRPPVVAVAANAPVGRQEVKPADATSEMPLASRQASAAAKRPKGRTRRPSPS